MKYFRLNFSGETEQLNRWEMETISVDSKILADLKSGEFVSFSRHFSVQKSDSTRCDFIHSSSQLFNEEKSWITLG